MYFSSIPDIKYNLKPISYPFSESDFITTKNFFRRYKINPDVFGYSIYYTKYSVKEGERLDTIAKKAYGDQFYDWVIVLTNNFMNPQFSFPLDSYSLQKIAEYKYGDEAYSGIHHYEVTYFATHKVDGLWFSPIKEGTIVDENFYNSSHKFWNGVDYHTIPGNQISKAVTNIEYEEAENEKRREIFLLKRTFFKKFLQEFKSNSTYTESSDFITNRLKKVAV